MFNAPLFLLLPVHDTAMAGDDVPKILDLEGSLETRGEEAAERSDDGGKQGHAEGVQEEGVGRQGFLTKKYISNWTK